MAKRRNTSLILETWRGAGAGSRLLAGALLIAAIGVLGQSPHTLFGMAVPWPHAALWGAVGWARAGLALRPMLVLIALGIAQDMASGAPIGSFVLINLLTFGLAAMAHDLADRDMAPLLRLLVPAFVLLVGFFMLWLGASNATDNRLAITPLVRSFAMTTLVFYLLQPLFDLGGPRPGARRAGA